MKMRDSIDSMQLRKAFAEASTRSKSGDSFYVKFLGLSDNMSNLLGRQVRTVNRPEIRFEETEVLRRGNQYKEKGFVRFNPVSITFWDDEGGITSAILYRQVMRQLNKAPDVNNLPADSNPSQRDYRFDIEVEILNARDEVVESYVHKNCFISEISHDPLNMDEDADVTLTVMFAYDNIEFGITDSFEQMLADISV